MADVDDSPERASPWRVWALVLLLGIGAGALWVGLQEVRRGSDSAPAVSNGPEDTAEAGDGAAPFIADAGSGRIGDFESGVHDRLAAEQTPVSPLTGGIRTRVDGLRWNDAAVRPFLRISRLDAVVDAGAMTDGHLRVARAEVQNPRVLLIRATSDGPWNYEPIFADGDGNGSGGAPPTGALATILNTSIRNAEVDVRLPEGRYVLDDASALVSRVIVPAAAPTRPRYEIASLSGDLTMPNMDAPVHLAVRDGEIGTEPEHFDFRLGELQFAGAEFTNAEGSWTPGAEGLGLAVSVERASTQFADLGELFPQLPEEGSAVFALDIEPGSGAQSRVSIADLTAESGESRVQGALALTIGGPEPELESVSLRLDPLELSLLRPFVDSLPFGGTLRGQVEGTPSDLQYDLNAQLAGGVLEQPVAARLSGSAALADGFTIQRLDADLDDVPLAVLRAFVPDLPLQGNISGRVTLRGPPGRTPIDMNVRLDIARGVAVVQGSVDLTGQEPSYDVAGRLISIQLQELLLPEVPPVFFTGNFSLSGTGTDPATAAANVSAVGRFSGWETAPGDTLALAADLQDGTLDLETLSLTAGPVALSAEGEWRFVDPGSGGLSYSFVVSELESLAPYIPAVPDSARAGEIAAAGTVGGTLETPRIAGSATVSEASALDWSVREAELTYDLVAAPSLPQLAVEGTATDVVRPDGGAFESVRLTGNISRPAFAAELLAEQENGGTVDIAVEGRREVGEGEVVIRRVFLDLQDERWRLAAPTEVRWGDLSGVAIDSLVLEQATGVGQLAIDGRILSADSADLRLEARALPIGELLRLTGTDYQLSGGLWTDLFVTGSRGDPSIEGNIRLRGGEFRGVRFDRIEGEVAYADQRAEIDLMGMITEGQGGSIEIAGELPIAIDLEEFGVQLLDDAPLVVDLSTSALPLELAGGFTDLVQDPTGVLTADIGIAGTLDEPELEGSASIAGGAATVPELNRRFQDVTAELSLAGRVVEIERLEVYSDGQATATGTVRFEDDVGPVAQLQVALQRFRPIAFPDLPPVAAWGELEVSGPLSQLTIGGNVRVNDGSILIPVGGPDPFETEFEATEPSRVAVGQGPGTQAASPFGGIRIDDLDVSIGNNVWFEVEDARAQLAGDLSVSVVGEAIMIVGILQGERGTYTLRAGPVVRRFEVVDARVQFYGNRQPNPGLDITASRMVPLGEGGRLDVLIHVGGTLERPSLSLASGEGPALPESELLSFILFGQPGVGLGTGGIEESAFVQGALLGGVTEWASLELEQAVVSELGVGLDVFQVRLGGEGPLGFGAPTVLLGKEVTSNVFLTVDAGLGTLFGAPESTSDTWGVRLEWEIDPEWTAELGLQPFTRARGLRRLGTGGATIRPRQEFLGEIRRRWTY